MRSPWWATAAACLVLSGCVAPALDSGAFQHNAIGALDSAVSTSRVAALALDARVDERITAAYADTVVTEAEEAIGPVEASFGTVDPPDPALDQLRREVLDQLGTTGDLLAEARIAVRRGDSHAMRTVASELRRTADTMDQHAEALQ
jgi:hypothetical protein